MYDFWMGACLDIMKTDSMFSFIRCKKVQEEKDRYIDLVEESIKDIIKDEVKSQLPQILRKKVSDFAIHVIQSAINESLENVILAKSSSQLKSTYEAAISLTEFELKKILLEKLQKIKSYLCAPEHIELYDRLVKSYKLDKDLFESYEKAYSLNKGRYDKDKDEDPPPGSDQGLKKQKTSKDTEPPKGSKSKDSKSSSSKGTKSLAEIIWQAEKLCSFDELISTPINFSSYVKHKLKIDNPTQEILVGPAYNLLKGTCKSFVELEYHFEECYKAVTDWLDWNNPEGQEYQFNLSKPLSLIQDQGHQVVPADCFFNNELEHGSEISSPVKVAHDKYAGWGISHWGIIYQDKLERNRLMRSDELYKFCDGTLTYVRHVLHDIASNPRMDYLTKRKWSKLNRKRSRIMIKATN
nr:hypothetical protein [Tanacetum cinerariifolium]